MRGLLTEKVVGSVGVCGAYKGIEKRLQVGDGGVALSSCDAVVGFGGRHGFCGRDGARTWSERVSGMTVTNPGLS
jgi:hypothetical protein